MKRVFLGGTCGKSTWREKLIPRLKIDYFNPVVNDWTQEAKQSELHERENCDYCLYVITGEMEGYYSLAEAVDDSNKRPEKTILCVLTDDRFTYKQIYSLNEIIKLVERNNAKAFFDLEDVITYLNSQE